MDENKWNEFLTLDYCRSFPDKSDFEHSQYMQGNDVEHDSGWCHRCHKWWFSPLDGPPGLSETCEKC